LNKELLIKLNTVGARVRYIRRKRRYTQKALASKVFISQPTLSRIECESIAEEAVLFRIASELDVNVAWLHYGYPFALPFQHKVK